MILLDSVLPHPTSHDLGDLCNQTFRLHRSMSEVNNALLQLDEQSRREMAQWVESEVSKAKMRSHIHGFTDICFKKCVSDASSAKLSTNESLCLQNCLSRFLDTNASVVKFIQQQQ